ncbi:hypothetical protein HJC23_000935 [Cyclotella cryptica]|uniref:Sulfotransferase n=1 Tax=Cyclotella cryptica TaxID=29204 RepID=A0ABD3QMR8_9STRA
MSRRLRCGIHLSAREAIFVLSAAAIFLGALISFYFEDPSLGSISKTKANDSFHALDQWDDFIKSASLYDELRIDPYSASTTNNQKVYKYSSPYEQRFPNYKRPYWAEKTIPYNDDVPTDMQICFVHVGKAGGSTVGCSLGFSLHCSSDGQNVPGLLPIITTHAFHRGVFDCRDDAAYYLFVVRDPLERMLSAFNYDRPPLNSKSSKSQLFMTQDFYNACPFWTLDDVAQNGLLDNGDTSFACQRKARLALDGTKEFIPHWFFNYQYYYEFIPPDGKILVIRNNYIVDDWNSIEHFLGGRHDVMNPALLPVNNVHDKNSTDLYLSYESRMVLCRALCNEIQFYKTILRKGANLMEEDVLISLEELRLQCPIEATRDICDAVKPDISQKIDERKGC